MDDARNRIRCQFSLTNSDTAEALHVGSVLDLIMEVPEQYAGDSVGNLRCRGRVVAVEEAGQPGQVTVVCEIDDLECEPDLWQSLAKGPATHN